VFSYPTLTVPEARAWCVGDRARITELLGSLTHLGKLRRLGFGRIGSIEIVDDAEPERHRWNIRTLPDAPVPNRHMGQDNLRAPYWDRTRREFITAPATRELVRAAGW
jgi:CRISPR type IV-associated protein Csf3